MKQRRLSESAISASEKTHWLIGTTNQKCKVFYVSEMSHCLLATLMA